MKMEYTIDGVDFKNERLMVHDEDLMSLIQRLTYVESIFYLFRGCCPSKQEATQLDQYLVKLSCSIFSSIVGNTVFDNIAHLNVSYERKIISCMALMNGSDLDGYEKNILTLFTSIENKVDFSVGLTMFVFVPLLVAFFQAKNNFSVIKNNINKAKSYIDIVYMAFTGKNNISASKKNTLDKLLIALYAGFGITTPSIILPRFSASTKAAMSFNLIAGFTGSGSAHVGACREMMLLLGDLKRLSPADMVNKLQSLIDSGKKIPGFGHPLFYKDPRPDVLYRLAMNILSDGEYLDMYRLICKFMLKNHRLHPNVDAIAAALLSTLSVCSEAGSILFLYARMPAMIAHSIEKKSRPAFGFKRSEMRERFERFPVDWI